MVIWTGTFFHSVLRFEIFTTPSMLLWHIGNCYRICTRVHNLISELNWKLDVRKKVFVSLCRWNGMQIRKQKKKRNLNAKPSPNWLKQIKCTFFAIARLRLCLYFVSTFLFTLGNFSLPPIPTSRAAFSHMFRPVLFAAMDDLMHVALRII